MENFTMISANNLSFIMNSSASAAEIIDFMRNGAVFRDFGYILRSLRSDEDTAKILSKGLSEITGENYASVSKKVRNWMAGKNLPKNRETLFQMCFILKLTEDEANVLMGRLSDTGIHYRNPEELAFAYAFRTGKDYKEACALRKKALKLCRQSEENTNEKAPEVYTRQVKAAFDEVHTDEEFDRFFTEHGAELGTLHKSAHRKFSELLSRLQSPESYGGPEGLDESYTIAQIIEKYIRLHVPAGQKKGSKRENAKAADDLDVYRKIIKKYWPGESTLIRMRNKTEDVDRKTLLLLYLATEAFDDEEDEDFDLYEDLEDDPDALLEIRIEKMKLFLDDYGMNPLDPGNPFDFLMIYAMRTQEDEEARLRMEKVLELLYEEDEE